jgi:glutamate decarboxylase
MKRREAAADPTLVQPAFTERLSVQAIPSLRMPEEETDPQVAYRFIHDELMLDGNSRLNLATFVTTWMDDEAERLMSETFDKNMIDKDEYPSTAEIETRCVNMVASMFHAEDLSEADATSATGVSTIGSSEAVMLAGLAMKWRWRAKREAEGKDTSKPNFILGTNVQVVWEKFCKYFDVEAKYLPMEPGRYVVTPEQVRDAVDENTIGALAILGTTFTGELEPVEEIAVALDELAKSGGPDVPMHVDAASGGFVVPFLQPDLEWDFRNPRVVSINVSGHKYGLTYPGIGFVVWRSKEYLPEDLVFHVNYLGGDMPTFTLNFSRPGNQVVAQYYNFIRLGRTGYTRIMEALRDTAMMISANIATIDGLNVITDGSAIPVLSFNCDPDLGFTVFDISHELRALGFQVPAYTMPADAEEVAVLRVVVREGFNRDMGYKLGEAIGQVVEHLKAGARPQATHSGFAH